MDRTSEYAGNYFLQLSTIHGFSNGVYMPLVFYLLKDKKKKTQVHSGVLRIMKEECNKGELHFQLKSVVIDFEQATHV